MILLVWKKTAFIPILDFLATGVHGIAEIGIQQGTNRRTDPVILLLIELAAMLCYPKADIFKKGILSNLLANGLAVLVRGYVQG